MQKTPKDRNNKKKEKIGKRTKQNIIKPPKQEKISENL
jgi:hypothetical protein